MQGLKVVRFRLRGQVAYGLRQEGVVHALPSGPWEALQPGAAVAPLEEVQLLAPCRPSKVIAVGLNYAAHAAEAHAELPAEPVIFIKPPTTVVGPGEAIVYPAATSRWVEHEAELAVVIGRRARSVQRGEVPAVVAGYTCGNDVSARDLQRR
ncbi:MAG TPA: fumarylacetoacetate hydrolase family protein, partial [Anaerolineae bacterium]|nr:fumarylacetoacetate hydrolase family protein [Anaerolineae bacterium]